MMKFKGINQFRNVLVKVEAYYYNKTEEHLNITQLDFIPCNRSLFTNNEEYFDKLELNKGKCLNFTNITIAIKKDIEQENINPKVCNVRKKVSENNIEEKLNQILNERLINNHMIEIKAMSVLKISVYFIRFCMIMVITLILVIYLFVG